MKKTYAKKTFHRVGMTYTAMSILSMVLQIVVSMIGIKICSIENFSINLQMLLNSGVLYVVGFCTLKLGMRSIPTAKLEKHDMSVKELIEAFCLCYAILISSNLLGEMLTTLIGNVKGTVVENPVEMLTDQVSIPVLVILTLICAPIFEELFFRKFLIDKIVRFGEVPAILVSGLFFGLFHGNLSQLPYAFTLGIFLDFFMYGPDRSDTQ